MRLLSAQAAVHAARNAPATSFPATTLTAFPVAAASFTATFTASAITASLSPAFTAAAITAAFSTTAIASAVTTAASARSLRG